MTGIKLFRTILVLLVSLAIPPAVFAEDNANAKLVTDFHASWANNDIDKTLNYITDDCYYENIPPIGPEGSMTGKPKIRAFLADFFQKDPLIVPFSLTAEITNVIPAGEWVVVERVDHYTIASKKYDIPTVGIFRIRDGKIAVWKDYFDMKTFEPAVLMMDALKRK